MPGRPFQPGDPRINRGGRPRTRGLREELVRQLDEVDGRTGRSNRELVVQELIDQAIGGHVGAIKLILGYTDGLPVQAVEVDVRQEAERLAEAFGLDPDEILAEAERIARES